MATKQQALDEDWVDKVPKTVQDAADEYVATMGRKANANAKFNGARDTLIAKMREHQIPKVRVTYKDGEKIIELSAIEKVKLRKVKKHAEHNGEPDEE